jgi:hypothetical protein
MLMDGKCINIINIWRKHDISAGDDLILIMKKMVPSDYVLSRYESSITSYKSLLVLMHFSFCRQTNSYNRQNFGNLGESVSTGTGGAPINLEERRQEGVWQLVPWVYDMRDNPDCDLHAAEYDFR